MQENMPNINSSIPEPVIPLAPVQDIDQHPKSNNFLVILLIILLIISSSIAIFFAYQTQKMVKELTSVKAMPTDKPMVTEAPVATMDPTVNWKIYTNTKNRYSLKHPNEYTVAQNGMNSNQLETIDFAIVSGPSESRVVISVWPKTQDTDFVKMANDHYTNMSTYRPPESFSLYQKMDNQVIKSITEELFGNMRSFSYTIKGNYSEDGASESIAPITTYKYLWIDSGTNVFLITYNDSIITEQILSTFKFTI